MVYNTENKSVFKKFCLKRKLRSLERKRNSEIVSFIESHPTQAARMDNLEKNINSESFREINFKINAINRLMSIQSKN
jgi:molybdopterin-guanine dinucleotide biosynthesis protein A